MSGTKQLEELAKKFPRWADFFFILPPWDAERNVQQDYMQSFYNMQAIRGKIDQLSMQEAREFLDSLLSNRIEGYSFMSNMGNPFKASMPPRGWIREKHKEIKDFYKRHLNKDFRIMIKRGASHIQNNGIDSPMIVFRPYDFSVYGKE